MIFGIHFVYRVKLNKEHNIKKIYMNKFSKIQRFEFLHLILEHFWIDENYKTKLKNIFVVISELRDLTNVPTLRKPSISSWWLSQLNVITLECK